MDIRELLIEMATGGWCVSALLTALILWRAYPNGELKALKVYFYLAAVAALWIVLTELGLRHGLPGLADRAVRAVVSRWLMFAASGYFLWAICRRGIR
jgi:hypothetical protein